MLAIVQISKTVLTCKSCDSKRGISATAKTENSVSSFLELRADRWVSFLSLSFHLPCLVAESKSNADVHMHRSLKNEGFNGMTPSWGKECPKYGGVDTGKHPTKFVRTRSLAVDIESDPSSSQNLKKKSLIILNSSFLKLKKIMQWKMYFTYISTHFLISPCYSCFGQVDVKILFQARDVDCHRKKKMVRHYIC